jgi:hypothetical protein
MQCENCGRPLRPEERICPNCGEPVLRDTPYDAGAAAPVATLPPERRAHASGAPVDPFTPTIYGPPVGPDRYASVYTPPSGAPPQRYVGGYRPLQPLAPPPVRRRSGCLRGLAALSALIVLVALFVGALAATGQRIAGVDLGFFHTPKASNVTRPTPTATPACPAPPIDPQAAAALDEEQLSTGVQGASLRPVNQVSTFTAGQTIYLTFHVVTNQAGLVNVAFCTNGTVNGAKQPINVPAGYSERLGEAARGEFYLPLQPANVGPGLATLTWNGAIAAALPFTVTSR